MTEPYKIVARVKAPVVHGQLCTVHDWHCFVCHCFIDENVRTHQRYHEIARETTLTARSVGEAHKLIEFLEILLGAHVVREMDVWCDPGSP